MESRFLWRLENLMFLFYFIFFLFRIYMANPHRYVYLYAVEICHINTLFSHGQYFASVSLQWEGINIYVHTHLIVDSTWRVERKIVREINEKFVIIFCENLIDKIFSFFFVKSPLRQYLDWSILHQCPGYPLC